MRGYLIPDEKLKHLEVGDILKRLPVIGLIYILFYWSISPKITHR